MFVKIGFLKHKALFKFPYYLLDNSPFTSGGEIAKLHLLVTSQHPQDRNIVDDGYFKDNCMVVCYDGHPVVDIVIYSQGLMYLISISIQSYTKHSTNARDVFISKVSNSNESVFAYYCNRAPYSDIREISRNSKWTPNVKTKVKFVYITPDSTKHNFKTITEAQHVCRINGESLRLFGNSYGLFQDE